METEMAAPAPAELVGVTESVVDSRTDDGDPLMVQVVVSRLKPAGTVVPEQEVIIEPPVQVMALDPMPTLWVRARGAPDL